MRSIINTLVAITFSLTIAATAAACGGGDSDSCDKVVDHTLTLIPAELKDQMGSKKEMVAKCEEQPKDSRKCAMAAKNMEDLMGCSAQAKNKK